MPDTAKKLIIGNWKMNGLKSTSLALAKDIGQSLLESTTCDVVLCPPATLLFTLVDSCTSAPVSIGAQDCHPEESGAYTGDISPKMIKDAGCDYVIVGHSERRNYHSETSDLVAKKAEAAHKAGLTAIICIGETLDEYTDGKTLNVLETQLAQSIPSSSTHKNTVIAYEPVWAIGTGKVPTSKEIAESHEFIYKTIINRFEKAPKILYGGSAKPNNAENILSIARVDGLLVGGASLNAKDFLCIIDAAKPAVTC